MGAQLVSWLTQVCTCVHCICVHGYATSGERKETTCDTTSATPLEPSTGNFSPDDAAQLKQAGLTDFEARDVGVLLQLLSAASLPGPIRARLSGQVLRWALLAARVCAR
jgi:hypothetical protein